MAATPLFGTGNSTSATAANANSATISKPANVAVGDLLIAIIYNQFSGGTLASGLSGWTAKTTSIGPRSGGIYYLPVTDSTVLAGLPASWTPTFGSGQGGRLCFLIFRVTGADISTDPFDGVGTVATQNTTSPTVVNAVTAASAGLLLALNYWNNSSATTSTVTPDAAMTDGQQISSPTTGNTSGIDVAYQQLAASGSTGTRTFATSPAGASNSGLLFVIRSGSNSYTASGDQTVTASTSAAAVKGTPTSADLTVTASTSAAATRTVSVTAATTVTASSSASVRQPIDDWMASLPLYIAHRGGSANWDQSTMYAYDQAAAWSSQLALEVPVWKSADGVWVVNHDNDPSTTGTWQNPGVGNITARNWTGDLANLISTNGYPMIRLIDVLAKYGSTRIIWIENKGTIDVSGFFTLLDSYAGFRRYVIKQYYDNTSMASAAHARGYKTWGYYYDADAAQLPSTAANWDILGMQYNASSGSWTAVKSYGKPVVAHIVATAAQKATATANGADGFMSSGVMEVVPATGSSTSQTVTATTAAGAAVSAATSAATVVSTSTGSAASRALAAAATATVSASTTAAATGTASSGAATVATLTTSAGATVIKAVSASTVVTVSTVAAVAGSATRDVSLVAAPWPSRWATQPAQPRFAASPQPE